MKNKSKIINYLFLATIIGVTSCSAPTLEQQNQQKIIDEIRSNSLTIPSSNTGAVSGTVKFLNNNLSNGDIRVNIIRQSNIPKVDSLGKPLDITGKEFKDSKTQTQAFLEKKNDSIANEVIPRGRDTFLISNLKPGDITIKITSGNDSFDALSKIESGKVTSIPTITLGSLNKSTIKTGVNIKGRVLRPDGTPVANANVADVTQNAATTSTKTNALGEFILQVNSFNKPKNLEASLDSLSTSLTVTPDNTEDVVISLVANSRVVKGVLLDSINKKPIANMTVKSVESNSSTSTNDKGEFILRGVSTNFGTLEFGPLNGYVLTQSSIQQSTTNETILGNLEVRPFGNVLINIVADNFPDPIDFPSSIRNTVPSLGSAVDIPFTAQVNSVSAENIRCVLSPTDSIYYISNPFRYLEPISGTIQIEGTDIVQQFSYPATPTVLPKPKCGIGDNKDEKTVYLNNFQLSIPVNNLPGGEYTISVSLAFHETQKGIRLVVPSKDTISTELIQMRRVKRILSVGDVVGRVVIKDQNNNNLANNPGVKVRALALKGEVDLRDQALLKKLFSAPQAEITTTTGDTEVANLSGSISSYGDVDLAATADNNLQSGQYVLKNVPTGTRVIVAGVIDASGNLISDYLISSYSSLNVVSSTVNQAPDSVITKRVQ